MEVKLTAMQELRDDLITAIGTCHDTLKEIKDSRIKEACQAVVALTIDNVLNRIDTELLQMEKEQIIDFANDCLKKNDCFFDIEQYYNDTFKSK